MSTIDSLSPEVVARLTRDARKVWQALRRQSRLPDLTHSTFGKGAFVNASVRHAIRTSTDRRNPGDVKALMAYMLHGEVVILDGEQVFVPATFEVRAARYARQADAIDRRAARLSPEEAGETRAPEPVVFRTVTSKTGVSSASPSTEETTTIKESAVPAAPKSLLPKGALLSEDAINALRWLQRYGPLEDESGLAWGVLADTVGASMSSGAIRDALVKYDLVKVKRNAKRTFYIEITPKGNKVLANPWPYRNAQDNVVAFLRDQDGQTFGIPDNPTATSRVIGEAVSARSGAVRQAINRLVEEGIVTIETTPGGYLTRVTLIDTEKKEAAVPAAKPEKAFEPADEGLDSRLFEQPDAVNEDALQRLLDAAKTWAESTQPAPDAVTMELCEMYDAAFTKVLEAVERAKKDPREVFAAMDAIEAIARSTR